MKLLTGSTTADRAKYGARYCDPDTILELQYLLPEDEESWERSGRIVAFIRFGLAELGLDHLQDTVGTALECARLAHGDAVAAARFATARFLGGQYWRSTAQYGNPRGGPGGVTLRRGRKY